jgi:psiF repeat
MKTLSLIATVLVAAAFIVGNTHGQTAAPTEPAATSAAEKKVKRAKPFAPKSEKAKACSMKADEQKLRGKARKKFRSDCMKVA